MAIIPLYHYPGGKLVVHAGLVYENRTVTYPLHFMVDTGAEKTLILPPTQRIIEAEQGRISLTKVQPIQSIWGLMQIKVAWNMDLYVACCDGKTHLLNADRRVCFCDPRTAEELEAIRKGQVTWNLLGSDILSKWALYYNPGNDAKFLTDEKMRIEHDFPSVIAEYKKWREQRQSLRPRIHQLVVSPPARQSNRGRQWLRGLWGRIIKLWRGKKQ